MFRRSFFIGVLFAVAALMTSPRVGAAPDPGAFVGSLGGQGIQALGDNVSSQQRIARFRDLFQSDFDVNGIGRFAIGRYWRAYTPEQQQEFLTLFKEYTAVAYADRLKEYGGSQFRVTGVQNNSDDTVVTSEVIRPGGQPVQIDWHLIDNNGALKVADVYVDRISMKITQRDEFAKVIENNGGRPDALLAVLRQKLREGQQNPAR